MHHSVTLAVEILENQPLIYERVNLSKLPDYGGLLYHGISISSYMEGFTFELTLASRIPSFWFLKTGILSRVRIDAG